MKDLTEDWAKEVATDLNRIIKERYSANHDRKKQMGKKVIHLLCELGYTEGTKPDYERINEFVVRIGSNNPTRQTLWNLTYEEMHAVCTQVEQMHKKEMGL